MSDGVQKVNTPKTPTCVDCITEGVTTVRSIVSGSRKPRCHTHTRANKKRARLNAHARKVEKTYGITGEQYWALYEAQGGRCAICRWASGKTKRLAVDHDHKTGQVLGLLCGRCNVNRGFYGNESLVLWIQYNLVPPAPAIIGDVRLPVAEDRFAELDLDDDPDADPQPCPHLSASGGLAEGGVWRCDECGTVVDDNFQEV